MQTRTAPSPVCSTSFQLRTQPSRIASRNAFSSLRLTRQQQATRGQLTVLAAAWAPPTVADTKRAFLDKYDRPIPGLYSTVVNELLVQQHLIRFNKQYQYDEIFALGFVSVYDQIAEGLDESVRGPIFEAYIDALQEDPKKYRADAEALESWATGLTGSEDVKPDAAGTMGQQVLAKVAERVTNGEFAYSKFFAIGLFRLLELTGAKDPKALGAVVAAVGVRQDMVNRDLMTYKGVLSKMAAAKELMEEYMKREQRKAAERAAEKAEKAGATAAVADVAAASDLPTEEVPAKEEVST